LALIIQDTDYQDTVKSRDATRIVERQDRYKTNRLSHKEMRRNYATGTKQPESGKFLSVPARKKRDDEQKFQVGDRVSVTLHPGLLVNAMVRTVIEKTDGTRLQVDIRQRRKQQDHECARVPLDGCYPLSAPRLRSATGSQTSRGRKSYFPNIPGQVYMGQDWMQ
jgi:hypothetical protein